MEHRVLDAIDGIMRVEGQVRKKRKTNSAIHRLPLEVGEKT